MNAIQLRRARAKADGKCATCCKHPAIAGRSTCNVCYQRSRKSHGKPPHPTPRMNAAQRRLVMLSSPYSRARRRYWSVARISGETPIGRIVRQSRRRVGRIQVTADAYGTRQHSVRARFDAMVGAELRRRLDAAGLVDKTPFDADADRREEWLALTEMSLMRRVSR